MKVWHFLLLGIGVIGIAGIVGSQNKLKIQRKAAPPSPITGYARRVIIEFNDGNVRIVQFALHENGTVTWCEDQANPYRELPYEAQLLRRKKREAEEKQRQALEALKGELSATNGKARNP